MPNLVSSTTWAALRRGTIRKDTAAAFIAWAAGQHMGPRSVAAWDEAYQAYLSRPVR